MIKKTHFFALFLLFHLANALSAQSVFDSLVQTKVTEVYFDSGQYLPDATAQRTLDSVVLLLNAIQGNRAARITAHTDSVGSTVFNQQLAEKRATSIVEYLQKQGVDTRDIIITAAGENAPAASNSTESGRHRNRRVTIETASVMRMATFTGRITDEKTGAGLEALLMFRSRNRADSTYTDTAGYYSVRLPKDSVVSMEVQAKDHFFASQVFRVMGSPELYAKYKKSPNVKLPTALPGEKAVVRDLYFKGGTATLLPVSVGQLPLILKFMQVNSGISIEIGGHINRPFNKDAPFLVGYKTVKEKAAAIMERVDPWEKTLSEERAKTVYDYLRKNGIPAARMTYKGYNNSEMIFPYATSEDDQAQNRRVEITVLKKEE